MDFINNAVTVLQTLVIAIGAGLGIWGLVNLLEGYGNDNPGAKSQGMKQLMAGGGVHPRSSAQRPLRLMTAPTTLPPSPGNTGGGLLGGMPF